MMKIIKKLWKKFSVLTDTELSEVFKTNDEDFDSVEPRGWYR